MLACLRSPRLMLRSCNLIARALGSARTRASPPSPDITPLQPMPLASDLTFSTVDLIAGLKQAMTAETFVNRSFFPVTRFFTGRFCQVDSRKGRRLLAPVVKRGQPGRVLTREPIQTRFYDVPEVNRFVS
jgi:hypothetical protein